MSGAAAPAAGAASELRLGLACGLAAYALWGLFPLYLKQLAPTDAAESRWDPWLLALAKLEAEREARPN